MKASTKLDLSIAGFLILICLGLVALAVLIGFVFGALEALTSSITSGEPFPRLVILSAFFI